MPALARSVAVRMRAEMSEMNRAWRESGNEADKAGSKYKGAGDKAKQAARPITELETTVARNTARLKQHRAEWDQVGTSYVRAGALIVGAGVLMAKAAMDWESAWTGVTKTVNASDPALRKIEAGLRGLAKTMPETHTQIAAVAEAAGQLGVKAGDVVAFTKVMVMLGDTTNLTAEEAATSIAQLMNVMQTAPEDVDRVGAALVSLGNNGASTERDIVQMAQRIAGAGKIVGLSEANVLSLANALASSGIEVEAGGSAISNVLIDISKAVDTGSDKLDTFASVAGTTAQDFSAKWKADPATALADFTEGLGRMADNGENVFGTLEELGQSDVRVTRALLNMANAGDLLRTSLSQGDAAWQRNNALTQEAAKRYDTTAARAQIAWNNIKDNAIDAGQGMLPIISGISDAVSDLASGFGALPGPVKGGLGVLATGTGIALLTAGAFMKVVGTAYDLNQALAKLELSGSAGARGVGKVGRAATLAAAALTAYQLISSTQVGGEDVAGTNKFVKELLGVAEGSAAAKKRLEELATLTGKKDIFAFGPSPSDIKGVKDLFESASRNKLQTLGNKITPYDDAYDTAQKGIKQVDQALTSMVQSGAVKEAAAGFAYLRKETGLSVDELEDRLPGYAEAIAGVANEQKLAEKSSTKAADKAYYLEQAYARMGGTAEEAEKRLSELRQATEDAGNAFADSMAQIDEKSTLKSYIADLEEAAEAQEKWADNMVKAAARGVDADVLAKLQEQGPAAAGVLDDLANGSQKSIDKINDLFGRMAGTSSALAAIRTEVGDDILVQFDVKGDKDAVAKATAVANATDLPKEYVRTILEAMDWATPDINRVLAGMGNLDNTTANPTILTDDDRAKAAMRSILATLRAIDGNWFSNIIITKTTRRSGDDAGNAARGGYTGMQIPAGYAGGGVVPGRPPANPREDNVMAYGARSGEPIKVRSGEWIINEPQSRKNNKWLAAVNAGLNIDDVMLDMASSIITNGLPTGYADGGQVDAVSALDYTRMRIRIRDLEKSLKEKEKYGKKGHRKSRYVLRGLDRTEARQELVEAREEYAAQKNVQKRIPKGMTADAYNSLNDDRASASASFAGNADITSFSSPQSVERSLAKAIADMATFTTLLIDLKRKGAAPWLLAQLQKAGPTRGAINLARKYASDSKALKAVNAQAAQLDAVSGVFGSVTSDPRWAAAGAWSGSLTASQTKTLKVEVSALDATTQARETTRHLDHALQALAMGAGV